MAEPLDHAQLLILLEDFLVEHFDVARESITPQVRLRELGIDSIMMLDIMLEMEDRLGVKLKDLATPAQPTVADVVALIERNLAAART